MKVKIPDNISIYMACGNKDMRKQIDGLNAIVSQSFDLDPFSNAIFLFSRRRKDRIKALLWEGDGFLLMYKRSENGKLQWPKNNGQVREISPIQYRWLIEGLSIDQKKLYRESMIK